MKNSENVYQHMCRILAKRGGRYPGMDIPEFYRLMEELFTAGEAEVYCAIPPGFNTPKAIADVMGRNEEEVSEILELMADKCICVANKINSAYQYSAPILVPGIFEFQLMRGTVSDKDKRVAKLIHDYKSAVDRINGPLKLNMPIRRVIPIDKTIASGNTVHTYSQVASYIESSEPIAVASCFCRHEVRLVNPGDHCGKPDDVCIQFGEGARFIIDRKLGRQIDKSEAMEILRMSEDAGLVHLSLNRQEIGYICNCCQCHCINLLSALIQPKPGKILNSGFQPEWDADLCSICEDCIDTCPTQAILLDDQDILDINPDRCIGCGLCASHCPTEAIMLVTRTDYQEPPLDQKALRKAIRESGTQGF